MSSTKQISKAVNSLVNSLNTKKQPNTPVRRSQRRTRRNINKRKVRGPANTRGILAGYGSPLTSSFYINRSTDDCIVSGFDLLTNPLTDPLSVSFFMPVNPIAWAGTRAAMMARGYQNYRPLKIVIHYRPQVGSTDTHSLFIGTLWQSNTINALSSIEPSLLTSPGGTYVPAWQSVSTVVPCGKRLPQNMFPIRDPASTVTPFYIIARSSNGGPTSEATELPGRIFIEYTFHFHNAIGGTDGYADWKVSRSQLGAMSSIVQAQEQTGVVCDAADPSDLPIGSTLTWDKGNTSSGSIEYSPVVNGVPRAGDGINTVRLIGNYGEAKY